MQEQKKFYNSNLYDIVRGGNGEFGMMVSFQYSQRAISKKVEIKSSK